MDARIVLFKVLQFNVLPRARNVCEIIDKQNGLQCRSMIRCSQRVHENPLVIVSRQDGTCCRVHIDLVVGACVENDTCGQVVCIKTNQFVPVIFFMINNNSSPKIRPQTRDKIQRTIP